MSQDPGPGPIGSANIGSAAAIFDDDDRILLVRHTYRGRHWSLPGGIALPGEEPAAAAARELLEETGLVLAPTDMSGVYYDAGHDFGPTLHFVFRFPFDPAQTPVAMPPEIGETTWARLDDLPEPMTAFMKRRIHDAAADGVRYGTVD